MPQPLTPISLSSPRPPLFQSIDDSDAAYALSTQGKTSTKALVNEKALKSLEKTLRKVDRAATKLAVGMPSTLTKAEETVDAVRLVCARMVNTLLNA